MKKTVVLLAGLALAGLSTSAFAGQGFVRGEAGRSNTSIDIEDFGSDSDHDTALSLRGGYWFNPNIAVEGFYSSVYDKTITDGTDRADIKLSAIGVGVVAKKNFGPDNTGFFIDGRAGIARGKLKVESNLGDGSDTSTKPYFGVGVGYDFNANTGLSLNYDRLKGSGEGVDITAKTLTVGFEYRF